MIDAKEAATAAKQYLTDLYGEVLAVQVEEIELSDNNEEWLITLSYINRETMLVPALGISRDYKVFSVHRASGEVLSMKIRKV